MFQGGKMDEKSNSLDDLKQFHSKYLTLNVKYLDKSGSIFKR